jgi:hypothetical protein
MCIILFTRQEISITIWPNRNGNDHVFIITKDVDSQMDERSGRTFLFDPSTKYEAPDPYLSCSWTVAVI